MTTTMTDLQTGRTFVFNEALPGRDAYEEALAQGFTGDRGAWLAHLRGFAFDPSEPDWEVDRTYAANASVRHANKIWVAVVADTGTTPGTNTDIWQILLDGASAQELADAVTAANGSAGTALGAAADAETKRAATEVLLGLTEDAAQALSPIDALHPIGLDIPAGWWDTLDRLLADKSERAIICNWTHESLVPNALWRGTLASSVFTTQDGAVVASPGVAVGRVEDQSGNGLHLTQSSASLRPEFGSRPATGIRNILVYSDFTSWGEAAAVFSTGVNKRTITNNALANPLTGITDAVHIAESDTSNQQRIYTGAIGARVGDQLTVSTYAKADTRSHIELRLSSTNGHRFDLSNGTSEPLGGTQSSSSMVGVGGGWYRCSVTWTVTGPQVVHLALSNGVGYNYQGDGSSGVYAYGYQVENAPAAAAYQFPNGSLLDVTENGVPDVTYAEFDLLDDKLVSPAIPGGLTGQAFVAGDGGCYVTDVDIPVDGTFSIGGASHNWTGAAPWLLAAVTADTGRVLNIGARSPGFSDAEVARLERFNIAHGGKGLLVPGPELIGPGDFASGLTGWTVTAAGPHSITESGGVAHLSFAATVDSAAIRCAPDEPFSPGYYEIKITFEAGSSGQLKLLPFGATSEINITVAEGVWTTIQPWWSPGADFHLSRTGAAAEAHISSISTKRLTPREEL